MLLKSKSIIFKVANFLYMLMQVTFVKSSVCRDLGRFLIIMK